MHLTLMLFKFVHSYNKVNLISYKIFIAHSTMTISAQGI